MTLNHLKPDEKLMYFFEQKLVMLKQYLSVTKEMAETQKTRKENDLIDLIPVRQNCIRRIESIDKSIEKIKRTCRNQLNLFSDKINFLTDRYLKDFMDILDTVTLIDKGLYASLNTKEQELKEELLKLYSARHAARSYGSKAKFPPKYLDTKR